MATPALSAEDTADRLRGWLETCMADPALAHLPMRTVDRCPDNPGAHRMAPLMWVDAYDLVSATIRRTPHVSEGDQAEALHVQAGVMRDGRSMEEIRSWLAGIAALLRQDADIVADGLDPCRPGPRHTRCHPVLAAAIREWGMDADAVASTSPLPRGMVLASSRYDNALYAEPIHMRIPGASITLTRRLSRRRVSVDSLAVTPDGGSSGSTPRLLFTEQEGVHLLSISPLSIPETTLGAVPGRRVREILDGGASGPFAEARIVRGWCMASPSGPCTTFELEAGLATVS